ncbi:MAG: NAD(P)-dependent oxidoreductase [Candidatus Riflebacteria bacterium]|nr:NAD(P)-dependent oxidoreductase [Candidatus Riflebacteria bacterium]
MATKRVVVTGGTGAVGSVLVRRLVSDRHEVHLLVRPGHDPWRLRDLADRVRFHVVDLADLAATTTLLAAIGPERVFSLAACGSYSWQSDLSEMIRTNVVATSNLMQAALASGFEAFVHTGSSSEYGFKGHPPTEQEWLEPNSYYAVSKAAATLLCRYAAQRHRAHVTVLRLYTVYGPFEDPRRLVPTLIVRGLGGGLPPLVAPEIARDMVFVDDVVAAYLKAADRTTGEIGAVYNVGSGSQTTIREIVDVARRVLGVAEQPAWGSMPDRGWDTGRWVAATDRIRADLGWTATVPFEPGFRATVEWLRSHPELLSLYRARLGGR